MRTQAIRRRANAGFTLIEILIVVVILGILAAIVIPQFTSASEDAQTSSVQSQLQTVRSQIELHNIQQAFYPDFAQNGWNDLLDPPAPFTRYLQSEPRNAMRQNATDVMTGTAVPPADVTPGDGDGWYWNTDQNILYAINRDGLLMDW